MSRRAAELKFDLARKMEELKCALVAEGEGFLRHLVPRSIGRNEKNLISTLRGEIIF